MCRYCAQIWCNPYFRSGLRGGSLFKGTREVCENGEVQGAGSDVEMPASERIFLGAAEMLSCTISRAQMTATKFSLSEGHIISLWPAAHTNIWKSQFPLRDGL